jgi:arylsulfatase A-like enzyme
MHQQFLFRLALMYVAVCFGSPNPAAANEAATYQSSQPNIILILADDLGYGDLSCYNDQAKVATPNIDSLARSGLRFTDAHSPCTVCTPTRYGLMTGQMPFRVPNGGTVFSGVGGPSLIAPGRFTLPSLLRAKGYATACVGKWHVGGTASRLLSPYRRWPGGSWLRSILRHSLLPDHRLAVRIH